MIRRVPVARTAAVDALGLVEEPAQARTVQARPVAAAEKVLHQVAFNAEAELVEKLERLQELMGGATLCEVCDRAADLLLEKVDPARRVSRRDERNLVKAKKAQGVKAPKQSNPTEPRRAPIALADKTKVAAGRCEYVSANGVRCAETRFLTIDHVRPFALGGRSTDPANLRCYCAAHNQMAGRNSFGPLDSQRLAARAWE